MCQQYQLKEKCSMAELMHRDRLQPSLLDRLTDYEPDNSVESRDSRTLSLRTLRQSVLRDLGWLLNSTRLFSAAEATRYSQLCNSVINYGMPDISGLSLSGIDLPELERTIRQAIWDFEPRILRATLTVRAVAESSLSYNKITFEIEGDMWAQPYPERLYLRTELDMEGAAFRLTEAGGFR